MKTNAYVNKQKLGNSNVNTALLVKS